MCVACVLFVFVCVLCAFCVRIVCACCVLVLCVRVACLFCACCCVSVVRVLCVCCVCVCYGCVCVLCVSCVSSMCVLCVCCVCVVCVLCVCGVCVVCGCVCVFQFETHCVCKSVLSLSARVCVSARVRASVRMPHTTFVIARISDARHELQNNYLVEFYVFHARC